MSTADAKTSPSSSLAGSSTVNVGVPITSTWALQPQY
jgi:hypothetical protein